MKAVTIGEALLGLNQKTGDYKIGYVLHVPADVSAIAVLWPPAAADDVASIATMPPEEVVAQVQLAHEYSLQEVTKSELMRWVACMLEDGDDGASGAV